MPLNDHRSSSSRSISPALKTFLLAALSFFCYWQYGRTHFLRDPGSVFFDPAHAHDRQYSLIRQGEAQEVLARPLNPYLPKARDSTEPCLCANFVTVKRDVPRQYLYNAIGSLVANLTVAERSSIDIGVLFADFEPATNPVYTDPMLRQHVDDPFTYEDMSVASGDIKSAQKMIAEGDHVGKSTWDYTLALQRCLNRSNCPNIAIFEDDILLADSWLSRTYKGLKQLRNLYPDESWMLLRLFNQERSTGWGSRKIGGNNELVISVAVSSAMYFVMLALRRSNKVYSKTLTPGVMGVICLVVLPAAVVMFYQSGKASLLPPSPGVRAEDYGCCSQALVFNAAHVPQMIEFLETHKHAQYDMMTRDFSRDAGLKRISQYPMMAQHIGIQSTVETAMGEAQSTWSMAFEQLDPQRLASEHGRFVTEIFGAHAMRQLLFP